MAQLKLNKIEKLKRALPPVDYFERLERLDPSRIGESDRFYLKNFGIYGHKLAPDRFVLRVRVAGGRLSSLSFGALYDEARAKGASLLVTSRAQLELHGLSLRDAVELSRRVEEFGLTSWQTFTDNFRNIVTHPLDGLAEDSLIECYGIVLRMQEIFLKRREFVGELPRKFNTAVVGNRTQIFSPFANDLAFVAAEKEGRVGFNVYAGGKNTETALSLNLFVEPDEAAELFAAVATLYRDEGPRESRSRARLFHMIAATGPEAFREAVLERYGKSSREEGRLRVRRWDPGAETFALKDGTVARRYTTRFGELTEAMAEEVLDLCEKHDIAEVRLGCDQNLYLPGVPRGEAFLCGEKRYGGIVACAGSKYCVYSLMDTKAESARMALRKCEERGITVGFSGCLKGCARHAFSDIGLVGIRTKLFAEEVERGVRLYLGALPTTGERAGRLVLYAVPLRCVNDMVELLADLFARSGYCDFETFSKEVLSRYSEPALAFWVLWNFYLRHRLGRSELLLPGPGGVRDEKAYFQRLLENAGDEESLETAEYLRCQEAFPFREAIIHLERLCFALR